MSLAKSFYRSAFQNTHFLHYVILFPIKHKYQRLSILRLLSCPSYCKQCCNAQGGACVLLNYGFLWVQPKCPSKDEWIKIYIYIIHKGLPS